MRIKNRRIWDGAPSRWPGIVWDAVVGGACVTALAWSILRIAEALS